MYWLQGYILTNNIQCMNRSNTLELGFLVRKIGILFLAVVENFMFLNLKLIPKTKINFMCTYCNICIIQIVNAVFFIILILLLIFQLVGMVVNVHNVSCISGNVLLFLYFFFFSFAFIQFTVLNLTDVHKSFIYNIIFVGIYDHYYRNGFIHAVKVPFSTA